MADLFFGAVTAAAGLAMGIALAQKGELEAEREHCEQWRQVANYFMDMPPEPPGDGEPATKTKEPVPFWRKNSPQEERAA